ncbi:retrovirus-related pol polyprotein from transposon TNT 1-94 [Tanacetum coccineum]|uniref:Retrovirus-related pol polyprotein from transposon TNT 1-94 n=1 Tax=Tanacetum coccineum TaxID=301880 RepID=A0ABQ4XD60_9ASTR
MTTSSANNSVFRGFFEKQKLTTPNFINWYRQLRIVLSIEDNLNCLEQPIPPAPVTPEGQLVAPEIIAAHTVWIKGSKEIEEGQYVSSYILKMKGYIYNLEHLGNPVSLNLGVSLILISLRKEFNSKVQNGNNKHKKPQPQLAVRGQNQGKGKNKLAYAPKPKIPPPPKREDPAKDSICHQCEYMSQEFLDHLKDHGIIAHRTPPYTSQHNDVSEMRNRTLLDMVRSMMSQTTLLKSFWDYALETAACILNMVPTKKALVKRDTLTKPDKLEPRSIKCILIGYPKETMGYSFYYLPENKVLVARNAEFLENSLITQEASGSLEDLEIIQEEDTHHSIDTSLHHEDDDLEIDEPQNDIIPIRRSTRTRHALDRICLYIDAEEHELGDLGEPANYKVALSDPESDKWLNAMNWLFKKKTDMDEVVHTYKARLVVKGYTQTPRIDYEETFSHVADIRAIRILLAIAAFYDYEI